MKTIAYLRVSTDEQSQSGLGLEAQKAACAKFEPVEYFIDAGVSGAASIDKRPALVAALGALGRGDVLVIAKRDRLARDPIISATIERIIDTRKATLVAADGAGNGDQPADVLMRRMLDAFAEHERLVIKARTKAALGALRAQGRVYGQVPFGYDAQDGRLVPNEAEQAILTKIRALYDQGLSMRKIADALQQAEITNRAGGHIDAAQVSRLLKRKATA